MLSSKDYLEKVLNNLDKIKKEQKIRQEIRQEKKKNMLISHLSELYKNKNLNNVYDEETAN